MEFVSNIKLTYDEILEILNCISYYKVYELNYLKDNKSYPETVKSIEDKIIKLDNLKDNILEQYRRRGNFEIR